MQINFPEKSFCVFGLGRSGLASLDFLLSQESKFVLAVEKRSFESLSLETQRKLKKIEQTNPRVKFKFGSDYCSSFSSCLETDFLLIGPGLKPDAPILLASKRIAKQKILTEIDLAFYQLANDRELESIKLTGITGTNGKSTVTAWLSHIFDTKACGNFGFTLLEELSRLKAQIREKKAEKEKKEKYIFCELSSFQLYHSSLAQTYLSIITNISEDHLDWHQSFENYRSAKLKILETNQKYFIREKAANRVEVLAFSDKPFFDVFWERETFFWEFTVPTGKNRKQKKFRLLDCSEINLIGQHNLKNALFVLASSLVLNKFRLDFLAKLKSFSGLEHRLERFDTARFPDKIFFNDSKATNPESSKLAIRALAEQFQKEKVILFLGGRKKESSYQALFKEIEGSKTISKIFVFGEATQFFREFLCNKKVTNSYQIYSVDLFKQADQRKTFQILKASPEKYVLFSPACSSFDGFRNFEERGAFFKSLFLKNLFVS